MNYYADIFNSEKIRDALFNYLKDCKNLVSIVTDKTGHGSIELKLLHLYKKNKNKEHNWKIVRCSSYDFVHPHTTFSKEPDFNSVEEFIAKTPNYFDYTVLINGIEKFDFCHYHAVKMLMPKKMVVIGNTSNSLNETYFLKFLNDNIKNNTIDFVNSKNIPLLEFQHCTEKNTKLLNIAHRRNCQDQHYFNQSFPIDVKTKYKINNITKENKLYFDKNLFHDLKRLTESNKQNIDRKYFDEYFYRTVVKSIFQYTYVCVELEFSTT